jgi:hypothetical protein
MIGRLAVRSLTAHPLRTAVLAAGFGVGVAVMAILLGVAEIVLEQSRSPALAGGGDVVIRLGPQTPARLLLSGTLQSDHLRPRIKVAAPSHEATLYLMPRGAGSRPAGPQARGSTASPSDGAIRVSARGVIPSLERAIGNRESAGIAEWQDLPDDVAWTEDTPEKVLRQIDRFHPVPPATEWSSSWAEWLYFNGRAAEARFYLTFLVGPLRDDGRRAAGIRLQLDRSGEVETYGESGSITEADAQAAPDLTIGASSVRLDGLLYRIHLDLPRTGGTRGGSVQRVRGDLTIQASAGRLVPPLEITGARGWRSGYVVPVTSGALDGMLDVSGERLSLAGGTGYHDHNWGFWEGVSWQWGQVQQGDVSLLYGRVFPPRDAADPDRIPGFVGVLGPDGPLGYATSVSITETDDAQGRPRTISVRARSVVLDVDVTFAVGSVVTTGAGGPIVSGLDFLQMRGEYTVSGRAGSHVLEFTAPGSAETFRGAPRTVEK